MRCLPLPWVQETILRRPEKLREWDAAVREAKYQARGLAMLRMSGQGDWIWWNDMQKARKCSNWLEVLVLLFSSGLLMLGYKLLLRSLPLRRLLKPEGLRWYKLPSWYCTPTIQFKRAFRWRLSSRMRNLPFWKAWEIEKKRNQANHLQWRPSKGLAIPRTEKIVVRYWPTSRWDWGARIYFSCWRNRLGRRT